MAVVNAEGIEQDPASDTEKKRKAPAWEQIPGEPQFWFDRFHRFLMAGIYRTLVGAYNSERAERFPDWVAKKRVPSSWDRAAKAWRWRERCAKFDEIRERARQDITNKAFKAQWDQEAREAVDQYVRSSGRRSIWRR
jgi:hypothetical protein